MSNDIIDITLQKSLSVEDALDVVLKPSNLEKIKEALKEIEGKEIQHAEQAIMSAKAHLESVIAHFKDHVPPELEQALRTLNQASTSDISKALDAQKIAQNVESIASAEEGKELLKTAGEIIIGPVVAVAAGAHEFAHLLAKEARVIQGLKGLVGEENVQVFDKSRESLGKLFAGAGKVIEKELQSLGML